MAGYILQLIQPSNLLEAEVLESAKETCISPQKFWLWMKHYVLLHVSVPFMVMLDSLEWHIRELVKNN